MGDAARFGLGRAGLGSGIGRLFAKLRQGRGEELGGGVGGSEIREIGSRVEAG